LRKKMNNLEELITFLEDLDYQWDIGHTGYHREARIWRWPHVEGRYSPAERETAYDMLKKAAIDAGVDFGE